MSLPIIEFNKNLLSAQGEIVSVQEHSGAGVKARNGMHFKVESDVFIPSGGRPFSINDNNWRQFLLKDGRTPCSRIIVEGANIFVRQQTCEVNGFHNLDFSQRTNSLVQAWCCNLQGLKCQ
jgi:NAD-specific glutamate dehydrogenase